MNLPPEEPAPFDDAALESEWRAQEDAQRRERLASDSAAETGRDRQYRRLARMLRESPPAPLPPDFAARVAARATATSDRGLEYVLLIGLLLALLVIAVAIGLTHAQRWAAAFAALAPAANAPAGAWLLSLCFCLAGSWMIDRCTPRPPSMR
jgi:hypothetical protein